VWRLSSDADGWFQIEQQEEEETDGEQEEYVDMLQSHVVELRHNLQAQDAENEQLLAECGALRQHVERVHEDWRVWAAQSAEALQVRLMPIHVWMRRPHSCTHAPRSCARVV
jgi:predicted RNase H-like nuclease (RuvC/YqgF family)